MVLKKQTVWLLTMLSLIIVLSVYYVMPGGQSPDEIAFVGEEEESGNDANEVVVNLSEELEGEEAAEGEVAEEEATGEEVVEDGEFGEISSISSNETFTTIRMELQANRDRMKEEFTKIRASDTASAEEKAAAHQSEADLHQLQNDEFVLEKLIIAKGFEDALVMAEDDQVRVIVQSEELTREQANEVLQLAISQLNLDLDKTKVAVGHTGANK